MREEHHLDLYSPHFRDGGQIPSELTCDGGNRIPELGWGEPPEGTRSFALIVDDPDAPRRFFVHWLIWNIPADARRLGSKERGAAVQGRNGFGETTWGGPCPPFEHGPHTYRFLLYALDKPLDLPGGADRKELDEAMRDHVIGRGELTARYRRRPRPPAEEARPM